VDVWRMGVEDGVCWNGGRRNDLDWSCGGVWGVGDDGNDEIRGHRVVEGVVFVG